MINPLQHRLMGLGVGAATAIIALLAIVTVAGVIIPPGSIVGPPAAVTAD